MLRLKSSLLKHYRCFHNLVNRYWLYVPHITTDFVSLSHKFALISYCMAHYRIYSKTNTMGATWKARHYKLPEFPLDLCGVCIAHSLVFCEGGADHYPFSFRYYIVCPLPIYAFCWPLSHHVNGVLCEMLLRVAVKCYFFFSVQHMADAIHTTDQTCKNFTMLHNFIQ